MHYYKRHIGDYRAATAHLTLLEHGVYSMLIDLYYLDEKPFPSETQSVYRRLRAVTEDERSAVDAVLSDFFVQGEDGYRHKRIDSELSGYQANAEKNRANGKAGGRPKKTHSVSTGMPSDTQDEPKHTLNQEPVTNNHIKTPHTPQGGQPAVSKKRDGKPTIEFKTFIANCRESGEKPIPEGDSIFQYAEDAGIEREWLALAWFEFKERHMEKSKRQADWRATFRNYVRNNWFKLWFMRQDGTCGLTTQGMQAKAAFESKAAN